MKATELLKQQHREVAALFKSALKSDDPDEQMDLAEEIIDKLTLHAALEEEIFYPAVREAIGTRRGEQDVLEAYEEHHVMKLLMEELPNADPAAENFDAKLTVLKEIVQHHVEEEEEEMFPAAEKKLGKARLEELAEAMEERAESGVAVEASPDDEEHDALDDDEAEEDDEPEVPRDRARSRR